MTRPSALPRPRWRMRAWRLTKRLHSYRTILGEKEKEDPPYLKVLLFLCSSFHGGYVMLGEHTLPPATKNKKNNSSKNNSSQNNSNQNNTQYNNKWNNTQNTNIQNTKLKNNKKNYLKNKKNSSKNKKNKKKRNKKKNLKYKAYKNNIR